MQRRFAAHEALDIRADNVGQPRHARRPDRARDMGRDQQPGGAPQRIVVAQRLSAALARALAGEFERAQAILERPDGRWGAGDPGPRRYDEASVVDLLTRHGLDVQTSHGVRIFSDHVPSALLDTEADRQHLLALEATASTLSQVYPLLGSLGAALHVLAHRH
jgi:hypothetical protein